MAARKKAAPKRAKRKKAPARRESIRIDLTKVATGVIILVALVVTAGLAARLILGPGAATVVSEPRTAPAPSGAGPATPAAVHRVPKYEVFPVDVPPHPKPEAVPSKKGAGLPRVAIIIDDMGYDRKMAGRFLGLDVPLTFSVLPHSPFLEAVVQKARDKGAPLMLHLPMEPDEYPEIDPGPGALLANMDPDRLVAVLEKDLDAVPLAIGVNNHMGSRLSAQADKMNQVFTVLKRRGLFYVDSRTTFHTKARQAARLLQVPFAQRDVFLDHDPNPDAVRGQIRELITLAVRHGEAVGIGHPHRVTYEILREMLPEIQAKVRLVSIAELVHPIS